VKDRPIAEAHATLAQANISIGIAMIVSSVLDGAKTITNIGDKFVIETDQPPPFGDDKAPSPFDFFLASFSACTAYFAQRYCRKWNLPHEGITVELDPVFSAKHDLTDIHLRLKVPAGFPSDHLPGLLRNAGACPVKKAMDAPPVITLELTAD
jgi:ribosomal protein S12 methylthiotransferase accessory factor